VLERKFGGGGNRKKMVNRNSDIKEGEGKRRAWHGTLHSDSLHWDRDLLFVHSGSAHYLSPD
jgi:hypothetical protein